MNWKRNILIAAIGAAVALGAVVSASAETTWQRHHPRRTEVNHRLENQNRRIDKERREGEITKQQANYLHGEDHSIRQQEHFDAHLDNSHVTKAEKHALNQEENGVSNQIGK